MGETTLSIPFTRDSALQLQAAFTALLQVRIAAPAAALLLESAMIGVSCHPSLPYISAPTQSFAAKAKAERPKRWDAMEYKFKGSGTDAAGPELFEVRGGPWAHRESRRTAVGMGPWGEGKADMGGCISLMHDTGHCPLDSANQCHVVKPAVVAGVNHSVEIGDVTVCSRSGAIHGAKHRVRLSMHATTVRGKVQIRRCVGPKACRRVRLLCSATCTSPCNMPWTCSAVMPSQKCSPTSDLGHSLVVLCNRRTSPAPSCR